MMQLNLDEAIARIDAGMAKAKEMNVRVSLAIVDEFGMVVQVDRMDGASPMSTDLAEAKALTALNFQRATNEIAQLERDALKMIVDVANFNVLAQAGGVPIFEGNRIRGAIGVSGASSQQEHEVAEYVAKHR
jgi:glc operon protein GlcG